jgi:hypothetical protein
MANFKSSFEKMNRHNLVKIKALLFLKWRLDAGVLWASASTIARVAGTTPDSMYVLLGR